jgi:predicted ATP-grasp superfamily ATP-dependent carboligase
MQPSTSAARPCIVLGVETQIGLGVVRELGRAGVPVIAIAHSRHAIGLASRHVLRRVCVRSARSVELVDAINAIGREFGECSLLAISEVNVAWLLAERARFVGVVPILPDANALDIVLDKQRTLQAARAVGIDVPESVEPASMADAEAIAARFTFPGVLKWKDPGAVAPRLHASGLALLKAEYVQTSDEFLSACRRYVPIGVWPLLQEYCAGQGFGQFFFMHRGEAVRRFQHLRIAEWPPEGGFSSVCDSVPLSLHVALQERSVALLKLIGWEGLAMVEYRLDPQTGRARLMEINGRLWGSFPLAVQCNAGFALLACALQGEGRMPVLPPLKEGRRCRSVVTELKRLDRLFFQPALIQDRRFVIRRGRELWRFLFDFVRPGVGYFVWSLADPKPFFADVRNQLIKLMQIF